MGNLRVALLGGSDSGRSPKRTVLEANPGYQIVYDSDGFLVTPQEFLDVNFDIAIIEQRLGDQSAFEFIKAAHALSTLRLEPLGRVLISSQFHETHLRIAAIDAGAVDCVFVSNGFDALLKSVSACRELEPDFAIRELITEPSISDINRESFQLSSVALDTLDAHETTVLKGFCQMKSLSEISVESGLSKARVNAALAKVQKLLSLDTRSQLLLRMYRLGALAL